MVLFLSALCIKFHGYLSMSITVDLPKHVNDKTSVQWICLFVFN